MSPLFRIWALVALGLAALFMLRGAWAAALAVVLLSPAPVLVLSRGVDGSTRASLAWLAGVAVACGALLAILLLIVSFGGLPPVHEWRAILRR